MDFLHEELDVKISFIRKSGSEDLLHKSLTPTPQNNYLISYSGGFLITSVLKESATVGGSTGKSIWELVL